jgi:hypothetical protein
LIAWEAVPANALALKISPNGSHQTAALTYIMSIYEATKKSRRPVTTVSTLLFAAAATMIASIPEKNVVIGIALNGTLAPGWLDKNGSRYSMAVHAMTPARIPAKRIGATMRNAEGLFVAVVM